jgi:hypothetical protein
VVRRMFADIDADTYVLVDGDNTYRAPSARVMVQKLVGERLDLVVGSRLTASDSAFRRGHRSGNRLFAGFVALLFGPQLHRISFRGTGCSRGASSNPFRHSQRDSRPRRNLPSTLSSCASFFTILCAVLSLSALVLAILSCSPISKPVWFREFPRQFWRRSSCF